ncbi:multidrug resistance efflux pump [Pleurocapsa sp. PCC 7327]|uniref:biotin/lipoyl-binding protein n=1 Tax=Pleurocapsa sp. PCC 7327 TaxID=118163 RepID=UPI00029FE22D|nr:HlyD family efflux transporter periplasmic adaptor subunit [Pleurocapsa sp. PCC 7327]AFY79549.1 multidrug resistance efflux pump [Pleurocapsa sp. PCC 7327]
MNSSNDKPPSANNRFKKRLLVVDGKNGRPDDSKTAWEEATTQETFETDDSERRASKNRKREAEQVGSKDSQRRSFDSLRIIVWTLVSIATLSTAWATLAHELQVEQAISATGQLMTRETIKEMQVPENKVVKAVFVKEGDRVKKGQPLVAFDSLTSYKKLKSLETERQLLVQQNRFYRRAIEQSIEMAQVEGAILGLKLPREAAFLVRNRTALIAANQQYRAQTLEPPTDSAENPQAPQVNPQKVLAELAVRQLQEQLEQNQSQQQQAQERLIAARQRLAQIQALVSEGAIARVESSEQGQAVRSSADELERLRMEQQRLQLSLEQARKQLANVSVAMSNESQKPAIDYQKQITDNKKQIAEIDSQLTKIVTENERQIAELERQIARVKPTSNSYILKAPADGKVFALKAALGFGSQPDDEKTLFKLKSDGQYLVVEVIIPKENIDFIQDGMPAEIKIDASSFSQLGNLRGQVLAVGSDALPPDAVHHFYGIPAKIGLERQALAVEPQKMSSRSGISATVTIKINKKQTLGEAIWQKLLPTNRL